MRRGRLWVEGSSELLCFFGRCGFAGAIASADTSTCKSGSFEYVGF